jgi:hypothetical protein
MSDINGKDASADDELLKELETSVRKILKSTKTSKADKLAAINAGTRLLTIKHRIANGDGDDKGFFGK